MLQLRPNCEHCDKHLAANSQQAMICSYECTFCQNCVESVLNNVCPNCGGGFTSRPIRPEKSWCEGTGLAIHPATVTKTLKPVDSEHHQDFSKAIAAIPAHLR